MNKRPVSYLQTDPRWKSKMYSNTSTIGGAGCGPTAASMLIETMTGKTYTPEDACKWSKEHGYAIDNAGTAYAYFKPQFEAMGIKCDMLNWKKSYGNPNHENHQKMLDMLKQGYYFIALMGPGLWTSGGHFVVVWWADDKIRINDPASTRTARLEGDPKTFFSQVNYYWWIDAREFNNAGTAEQEYKVGDIVEFVGNTHYTSANATQGPSCRPGRARVAGIYQLGLSKHPYQLIAVEGSTSNVYGWVNAVDIQPVATVPEDVATWAKDAWSRATALGLCDGTRPTDPITRQEAVTMLMRLKDMLK